MLRREFLAGLGAVAFAAPSRKPNIILILADDVGFSDLGCYGGEIRTPNLDALARGGVRFTHFYNCARCCPSRASLLTGLYPHQAGVGEMTGPGKPGPFPGYQRELGRNCSTLAEVLKPAGYATLMAGKWQLGPPTPVDRGFDEYFGLLGGFNSFWNPGVYTRLPAGRPQRSYPAGGFYATNAITDHALDFIAGARDKNHPYFLYLAYTAAHFPLHAPKEDIDRNAPVYEEGWDKIRETRFARQHKLGLVDAKWKLSPRSGIPKNTFSNGGTNPAWTEIDAPRRKDLARRMGIYAAMIEIMDRNIGRVVADLKAHGEMDNTLILFLSDNGACAEWDPWGFDGKSGPENKLHQGAELDGMGQPGTYHSYGSGWANACNTPYRLYKHYNHEGGIATPLIAHWPAGIQRKDVWERQPGHIIDIMPTLAAIAGARTPSREGVDLAPALSGKPIKREALYWEHEGNRAVRSGDWKLAAVHFDGKWELYNLATDPTELDDLAAKFPERVKSMAAQWEVWARRTQVLPWKYS